MGRRSLGDEVQYSVDICLAQLKLAKEHSADDQSMRYAEALGAMEALMYNLAENNHPDLYSQLLTDEQRAAFRQVAECLKDL